MKKVLFTLVILLAFSSAYSQKVKLKKDKILVDKVEKYQLERTKKGNMILNVFPNFILRDLDGNEIMQFNDSTMYFSQLPNELKEREYKKVFLFSSAILNKKAVFPKKASLSYKKYIVNSLKETGFFTSDRFTAEQFDSFVEMQELDLLKQWNEYLATTNIERVENYEKTKEMFSPLMEREPAILTVRDLEITDGSKKIGKFTVKSSGSHATTYEINNHQNQIIGTVSIIHKSFEANLRPFVLEEFINIKFEKDSNGQYPNLDGKLEKAVFILVEQGYL